MLAVYPNLLSLCIDMNMEQRAVINRLAPDPYKFPEWLFDYCRVMEIPIKVEWLYFPEFGPMCAYVSPKGVPGVRIDISQSLMPMFGD